MDLVISLKKNQNLALLKNNGPWSSNFYYFKKLSFPFYDIFWVRNKGHLKILQS